MGFPFEVVILQYFNPEGNAKGQKEKISEQPVKVLWNGSLTQRERDDRYNGTKAEAEVKILFNKRIQKPTPNTTMIVREGKRYKIVNDLDDMNAQLAYYIMGVEKTTEVSP